MLKTLNYVLFRIETIRLIKFFTTYFSSLKHIKVQKTMHTLWCQSLRSKISYIFINNMCLIHSVGMFSNRLNRLYIYIMKSHPNRSSNFDLCKHNKYTHYHGARICMACETTKCIRLLRRSFRYWMVKKKNFSNIQNKVWICCCCCVDSFHGAPRRANEFWNPSVTWVESMKIYTYVNT